MNGSNPDTYVSLAQAFVQCRQVDNALKCLEEAKAQFSEPEQSAKIEKAIEETKSKQ